MSDELTIGFDPTDLTVREAQVLICSRCQALVPEDQTRGHVDWHTQLSLEAWSIKPGPCGHTIEPAAPGVGRLTCTLRHGHQGDHEDRDGASWNPAGTEWAPE